MTVLAFDTCLGAVSVAVRRQGADGEWRVCDAMERRASGHAERLMPMIADVMEQAGLGFGDLERIAVTVGPGTFTGVRVGVAAARGLALATGLPVVGTTSLAVMAHGAGELLGAARSGELLGVAVDARRGMVYVQIFNRAREATSAPLLLAPQEVAALVGARSVTVVGSGAEAVASAITAVGGSAQASFTELEPHARSLALLADTLGPVSPLLPLYLRPPDVKPQADKSLSRASSS
jgi:tRNA threonylcarbamoyladenosine biosynthesis protein TsaB